MSKGNRGIGPVPEGLGEGLSDFLLQVRRHITDVLAGKVSVPTTGGSGGGGGTVVVIGGGDSGGSTYEPDLTPPPAPTGVVITGGFASVIFETDPPIFTQGHGHQKTVVYGKKYGGTGPLPTFSADAKQREFGGNIDAMPSDLGTQWHFWVTWVSKDGVESSQAGGVNGFQVTIGKIGHSDLGPLIVEADNLADGTVTAAKVAAGAVDLTKFANGIEPVTIVAGSDVPAIKSTNSIYLTGTKKMYRWKDGAYTAEVAGSDIVANSITAGQIAAGAIGAEQIAAGAITTGKLLVTGQGAALNADPSFKDPSAWSIGGPPGAFITITDGAAGPNAYRSAIGAETDIYGTWVAVDPGKSYRVRCRARSIGSNGTLYIGCQFLDGSGANIYGNGTFWYVGAVNSVPGAAWTLYQGIIGQGGPIGLVPSNAKNMRVLALLNFGASTGYMEVQDLRVEEAIGADLIVDGAIVAGKLAAGAIVAGSAAIADGAIRNALIENGTIDNAKIANVSAAKITAGSLSVGQHIDSSNFVTGVSGWRIHANGQAEFGAASIRGQLNAAQMNGYGLTIRKPDGSIVLDASGTGTPIHFSSVMPDGGWLNSNVAIPRGTMNADPSLLDAGNAWDWESGITVEGPSTATGALGGKFFSHNVAGNLDRIAWTKQMFPISAARTYNLNALLYAAPGNARNMYLVVDMFRSDGTRIVGGETGWGGSFAGYTFGGLPTPGQFTRYGDQMNFGAGTAYPIPSFAAYFRVGVWFQYNGGTGSVNVQQAAQDIRLTDVTDAFAAKTVATMAATDASSALTTLATMRSNGYIDAAEKPALIKQWQAISDEFAGISAQADSYGLTYAGSAIRQAWTDAKNNLGSYLSSLSPSWSDTTADTPITPATDQATWAAYYSARQALLNAISAEAGKRAQWGQVGGAGKPEDNATVGATIGSNLSGSFTQASWDVVMTSAFIRAAHIQQLTASNITVATLSEVVNTGRTASSPDPGRVEISANRVDVFDSSNVRRVRLGLL